MLKRILGFLGGFRIYILIATIAFGAGTYSGYKACQALAALAQQDEIDQIHDAEDTAIELGKEREIIYKDRIQEVIKYVEVNNSRTCLSDDELKLFNADYE